MILVTGAAGHLGNVLIRELLARGEQVRGLVLPNENLSSLAGLDIELFEGNILDLDRMRAACEGVSVVQHLAALVTIVPEKLALMRQVNIQGTANLLLAAREAGASRFVYTSSIHAVERPPHGTEINESLHFDPNNPEGPYDQTKAEASILVQNANQPGFETVIVCPTGVIGPYDFNRSEMGEMILGWMKKGPALSMEGQFDFVDVRDVAKGQILAAEKGKAGEWYLLSGEQISVSRIIEIVQETTGQRSPEFKFPAWFARLVAPLAEAWYRVTKTRPRFTRYAIETLQSNSLISSAKAREELGWQPMPIAESIRDTVRWWQENLAQTRSSLRSEAFLRRLRGPKPPDGQ